MVVARRYARALYEEAERSSKIEVVDDDMELIRKTLQESGELDRFFQSPVISRGKKSDVVRTLFESRLDPLTYRFLAMLIRKQREDHFPRIVRAFRDMRDEQMGVVEVIARSAHPLGPEERAELVEAVVRLTGKEIRLKAVTDAELIGGVVIRVGDTVYDGSARHQLSQLRDRLELASISLN